MFVITVVLYFLVDACRHSLSLFLKRTVQTLCKTSILSVAFMMPTGTEYNKIPTYGAEEI